MKMTPLVFLMTVETQKAAGQWVILILKNQQLVSWECRGLRNAGQARDSTRFRLDSQLTVRDILIRPHGLPICLTKHTDTKKVAVPKNHEVVTPTSGLRLSKLCSSHTPQHPLPSVVAGEKSDFEQMP